MIKAKYYGYVALAFVLNAIATAGSFAMRHAGKASKRAEQKRDTLRGQR